MPSKDSAGYPERVAQALRVTQSVSTAYVSAAKTSSSVESWIVAASAIEGNR